MTIPSLTERKRATRIQVTFAQLEAFEKSHHELLHGPVDDRVDPLIRQAEIDAAAAVAGDLRTELEELAGGRYACTERHPWDRTIQRKTIHVAADDVGGFSRCPRCGGEWNISAEFVNGLGDYSRRTP